MATHIVLGANGSAGLALTRALAARGHEVVAVSRSGPTHPEEGVVHRIADLTDPGATSAAVRDADVVHLAAQPGYAAWKTGFAPLLDSVLDAVRPTSARLVFVDNLYMYGPTEDPIHEDTPLTPVTRKGAIRKSIHDRLMAEHANGKTSVTIVRASDFFGPDAPNSVLTMLAVDRGVKDRTMYWPLTLDVPHSANYLPDTMRAAAMVAEDEATQGQVWHLPAHDPRTGAEWLALVSDHLPTAPTARAMPMLMLRLAGLFDADTREAAEIWPRQFARSWVIDSTKFERHFGTFERTPLDDAMEATVASAAATA